MLRTLGWFLARSRAAVIGLLSGVLLAADGQALFDQHCALCHGIGGSGGRGPALTRPRLLRAPDEAALKRVISDGLPPEMPGAWFLDDNATADLAQYVQNLGKVASVPLPGDPVKGAQLYRQTGCAGCHTVAGQGSSYGPDLSEIGNRRSAAHLEESLRRPAASVPEGFLMMKVRTAGGRQVDGVRVAETNFTLFLRDAAGRTHSFTPAQLVSIEKLRGRTSMPSYDRSLTPTQMQDLVAYLAGLRGAP